MRRLIPLKFLKGFASHRFSLHPTSEKLNRLASSRPVLALAPPLPSSFFSLFGLRGYSSSSFSPSSSSPLSPEPNRITDPEEVAFVRGLAANSRPERLPSEFIARAVGIFHRLLDPPGTLAGDVPFLHLQRALMAFPNWLSPGRKGSEGVRSTKEGERQGGMFEQTLQQRWGTVGDAVAEAVEKVRDGQRSIGGRLDVLRASNPQLPNSLSTPF